MTSENLQSPLEATQVSSFSPKPIGSILVKRALLSAGKSIPTSAEAFPAHVKFGSSEISLPDTVVATDEMDDADVLKRQDMWDERLGSVEIFKGGEMVRNSSSQMTRIAVLHKITDVLGSSNAHKEDERKAFVRRLSADVDVSLHERDWRRVTSGGDKWFSQLTNTIDDRDSDTGRLDHALRKDESAFLKTAIEKSRVRGEQFIETHGETIRESIATFPEIAEAYFKENGISVDLEVFRERFEQVKHRVMAVSYLDRVMPADALGVYYGDSHGIFLNSDILVDADKPGVQLVVFHELMHAVSATNVVNYHDGNAGGKRKVDLGVGIPHADWLNEATTEYLAREMFALKNGGNVLVAHGSYQGEVQVLTGILESNAKIKKLLLDGFFAKSKVGDQMGNSKTHQAYSMIEYVYGTGFVSHVEKLFDLPHAKRDNKEIQKINNVVRKPEIARKARKAAVAALLGAGIFAGSFAGSGYVMSKVSEVSSLEKRLAEEKDETKWKDIQPDEVLQAIELNSKGISDVKLASLNDSTVLLYEDGKQERVFNQPIYFETKEQDKYVVVDDNGSPRVIKLGDDNAEGYSAYIRVEGNTMTSNEVVVDDNGNLVDARTGQVLGKETVKEDINPIDTTK